jgi:hypothetical protein
LAEVGYDDVVGLEIAVDDAAVMRIRDRVAHLQEDLESFFDAFGRAGWTVRIQQPVMEPGALHQLHGEVGDATRVERELVHRHDVRMLQLARDLGLGHETVAVEGLGDQLLCQALQRDVAQQVAVGRRVNATHAAAPELRVDAEVHRGRNAFGFDLRGRHLVRPRDRNRFDDVDRLGLVSVGSSQKRPPRSW